MSEKTEVKGATLNGFKGKLITDFRHKNDSYEVVDVISQLPENIQYPTFVEILIDYFKHMKFYMVESSLIPQNLSNRSQKMTELRSRLLHGRAKAN